MSEEDTTPRKRGRRKKKKGPSGTKVLMWIGGFVLVMMVVSVIGMFVIYAELQKYLRGERFRELVLSKVESALKVEGELDPLSWEGSQVFSSGFRAQGYRDSVVAKLDVKGIRAEIDGEKNGAWQVPGITMNQLELEFSDDKHSRDFDEVLDVPGKTESFGAPNWLRRFIPTRTDLGMTQVEAATIVAKDAEGNVAFSLSGAEMAARPIAGTKNGWEVRGRRGTMFLKGVPKLSSAEVEYFDIRVNPPDLYINRLELEAFEGARLEVEGGHALRRRGAGDQSAHPVAVR